MGRQVNEREIVLAVLMEITENGAYSQNSRRGTVEISIP